MDTVSLTTYFLQISMNVKIAMATVSKAVLTPKEAIFALVLMDIFFSMQPTAEVHFRLVLFSECSLRIAKLSIELLGIT